MTGTLGIIFTAKVIKHIPFVTYWGRYSIMILVTHSLILKVLTPPILKLHLSMALTVILILTTLMFSYQILIPLMKKYLPYVTAQKDVIDVLKYVK
jgi:fucose 4-O-acetylase-like acetyltransferase